MTYGQVAEKLGGEKLSRSAVAGMIYRYRKDHGLDPPPVNERHLTEVRSIAVRKARSKIEKPKPVIYADIPTPGIKRKPVWDTDLPVLFPELSVTTLTVKRGECKAPVGPWLGADTLLCGADAVSVGDNEFSAWCSDHAAILIAPRRLRRRV